MSKELKKEFQEIISIFEFSVNNQNVKNQKFIFM